MYDIIYRRARPDEADEAASMERECFPPREAEEARYIAARVIAVPELFLVAYDAEAGRLAGLINGIAVSGRDFRDAYFTDLSLHDPAGESVMILGLEVLPDYRGAGIARGLMDYMKSESRQRGKKRLVLTCHDELAGMYRSMGFEDDGTADSAWGGGRWRQMTAPLG